MLVRIRFGTGRKVEPGRRKNRRLAMAAAALLTPGSLMSFALGFWRLAADLQWAGTFAIPSGLFSHWQVWMLTAGLLQLCSRMLNRYARGENTASPGGPWFSG